MPDDAYLYNQAGQAVAAVHLGMKIRHVGADPALNPTEILVPRGNAKARLILALTGLAAERKGAGASSPLRRTRNRQRVAAVLAAVMEELKGSEAKRRTMAATLRSQAQDRANAICTNLYEAIEIIAQRLIKQGVVDGAEVEKIVAQIKRRDGDGTL
ncbi:MAG TPA: hypothetical protein VHM90_13445 [Phycisphaerae bacterium]|nr:hypothetical protein [Phycisphaerae bacterium]